MEINWSLQFLYHWCSNYSIFLVIYIVLCMGCIFRDESMDAELSTMLIIGGLLLTIIATPATFGIFYAFGAVLPLISILIFIMIIIAAIISRVLVYLFENNIINKPCNHYHYDTSESIYLCTMREYFKRGIYRRMLLHTSIHDDIYMHICENCGRPYVDKEKYKEKIKEEYDKNRNIGIITKKRKKHQF